jgi:hypothetical protein
MRVVDDTIETIHLYVVREEEKQPYTLLPLFCALLCLIGIAALTLYSAQHPYYEHERLTLPAHFLPPRTFQASQPIIPTGVKTYPATTAYGILTITNGSVISQTIPQDFRIENVVTDVAVYVPAGSANGYGMVTVSAHAVAAGKSGNIPAYTINSVVGSSVYIRNLSPFTGGQDSYSVKYATTQDKQTALLQARGILLSKSSGLHSPCAEDHIASVSNMIVAWRCQFVQPPHINIPNARITGIRLSGKNLIIDVMFIAQPQRYWAR